MSEDKRWEKHVSGIPHDGYVAPSALQRDELRKRRKWQESKQETEWHSQGTEPNQQHRPKQNTVEAEEAAQKHKPS
jgi:hypothetical protein